MALKEDNGGGARPLDPTGVDAKECREKLYRFLLPRLRNNTEAASDVAQEAYLRYLRLAKSATLQNPMGYLCRIALNVASEKRVRHERRAVKYDSSLAEALSTNREAPDTDIPQQVETRERLQRALERMPANYRRVLLMNTVEGRNYRDIARELKLAPDTVLKYLARAKAHARHVLFELEHGRDRSKP